MRASPEPDPLALKPEQTRPDRGHQDRVSKFLLRMPPAAKDACRQAAEREGLSMNVWATRVLVEHAKRSREGWRSIPIDDYPKPIASGGVVSPPEKQTPPSTGIWPAVNPHTTYVSTGGSRPATSGTLYVGPSGVSNQGTVSIELHPTQEPQKPVVTFGSSSDGLDVTYISLHGGSGVFDPPESDIPDFD